MTATLGELPVESKTASKENERPPSGRKIEGLLGVEVADLDARWRRQLEIPTDVRGAMVLNVDQDSPAYAAGTRQGDVILEINRQKIRDARDAVELSRKLKEARALLRIWSKGATCYAVVEPVKKP